MSKIDVDWSKAPEGATHCTPAVGTNSRPVFWRVTGGVARECWAMAMDFSSVRDHFTYGPGGCMGYFHECAIERPAPWSGEGLPPVGAMVEIRLMGWSIRESAEKFIGVPLRVAASFGMDCGTDMIAVDGGPDLGCEVFRAEMAVPARTPEQIAAEEREKEDIRSLASAIHKHAVYCRLPMSDFCAESLAMHLYADGCRVAE